MKNLNVKASLSLVVLALVMGVLLFVPAGTIHYWQAWVYLGTYFAASTSITLYLMKRDPALLQRRMKGGPTAEKQTRQKVIMLVASLAFIALFVVSALDHRMRWSQVPLPISILGDVLTATGFLIVFMAFHENSFASATIEVAGDQRVVSTGPYAIVRHPMYVGGILLVFGTPLALGSYWGLLAIAVMMPFLLWRLLDEERFLVGNLRGYRDYCERVRRRLIPGVF